MSKPWHFPTLCFPGKCTVRDIWRRSFRNISLLHSRDLSNCISKAYRFTKKKCPRLIQIPLSFFLSVQFTTIHIWSGNSLKADKQAVTQTNYVRWHICESMGIITLIRVIYDIFLFRNLLQYCSFICTLFWSVIINKIIYVFCTFASQN